MAGLQHAINITVWVLFALASVAIVLRFGSRVRRGHKVYLDDWVMLFSWLCDKLLNLAACICSTIAVNHGIGIHVAQLEPKDVPNSILWGLVATNVGLLADTFPKLAVALLVNRLLAQKRWMNYFTLGISSTLVLISIILIILGFEQCQPISHQWNRETPGKCLNPLIFTDFAIFAGAYSAAIDLFFSLYPPFVISKLHMALKKRITIMALLSLGLFTFAVTTYKTADQLPTLAHEDVDVTRVVGQIMLWTIVESSVTIIAGSIPTWGWLLRTDGFEKIITWITMHSIGSDRSHELQESEENLADINWNDALDKKGLNRQVAQDSVAGLEREAHS